MIINHNLGSMNANRQMGINAANASKSMEKLSSGLRINKAGDDAAGLAISEKMRGQIRGLDQASANSQSAISLLQTGEGALNETHSILQRMRELAVQGSNDTLNSNDRGQVQKEMDALTAEIDRIGNNTEFNTKNLLNGGAGLDITTNAETVGGANADWINITGGSADTKIGTVNVIQATAAANTSQTFTADSTTSGAKSLTINGTTINYTSTATTALNNADAIRAAVTEVADQLGITVSGTGTTLTFNSKDVGSASTLTVAAGAQGLTAAIVASTTTNGSDATITTDTTGGATAIASTDMVASGNLITVVSGNFKGMEIKLNSDVMSSTAANNDTNFTIEANGTLNMQIGANENQTMGLTINDMRAAALGVNAISVSNSTTAGNAITTIQTAIDTVSSERSKLGAFTNRLEHTIANLGTAAENMTAAESRIRDVDMAKEMSTFSKNNILSQAAQAMLAQANQQPQQVLQLLR